MENYEGYRTSKWDDKECPKNEDKGNRRIVEGHEYGVLGILLSSKNFQKKHEHKRGKRSRRKNENGGW